MEDHKMELEVLRKDMVAAMKAKDKVTKEAVSSLIAAVKKVAIDKGCRDDIKGDLVDRVIQAYIEEKFADVLATGNKGQIMKAVMGDLKGKADGKLINQVVAGYCK